MKPYLLRFPEVTTRKLTKNRLSAKSAELMPVNMHQFKDSKVLKMNNLNIIYESKCRKCKDIYINTDIVPSDKPIRLIKYIIIIYRYYLLIHRYLGVYNPVYDYISRHFNKGINIKKYGTFSTMALIGMKPSVGVGFEKCIPLALISTNVH